MSQNKLWFSDQLTIHTCPDRMKRSSAQGLGRRSSPAGAVSINICFYEWKVGSLEKLLPMWTLACLGGRYELATPLRAGTHAGSTATHDPQPIRSFISLERVPRPRATIVSPRGFLCLLFAIFCSQSFLFFSFFFSFSLRIELDWSFSILCCISIEVWLTLAKLGFGLG